MTLFSITLMRLLYCLPACLLIPSWAVVQDESIFSDSSLTQVELPLDATTFLQTKLQATERRLTKEEPVVAQPGVIECAMYYPIHFILSNMEGMRVMGYVPPPLAACDQSKTDGSSPSQVMLLQTIAGSRASEVAEMLHGHFRLPACTVVYVFLVACFWLIFRIFQSVLQIYTMETGPAFKYPEAEAWKSSVIDWLWMGWATQWVARWGTANDSAITKIKAADIPLSHPEDECDICFQKFKRLWAEEVSRVGLANACLLKVVTRFVTYRKVFSIGAWNACYEGFLFLGPPLAIKWVTRYLSNLYTKRGLGEEIHESMLVWPSVLLILIFSGLPCLMAISNSMCNMLNGRISIRIDGALSLAVYDKAQRLPVVQDDGGELSLAKQKADRPSGKRESCFSEEGKHKKMTPEDEEFFKSPVDEGERMMASGGTPKRFNLVQVVTNDINTNLMTIPNSMARIVVMVPVMCGTMCMLIGEIGWAFIFSLGMAITNLALMTSIGFMMRNSLAMFYTTSGKRLQFLQEVMVGIRFIKGCGAEGIVQDRLQRARAIEIRSLDTFYTIQCFMFVLSLQFPKLYLLGSLGGYALFHHGIVEPTVIMSLVPLLMSVQGAIAVVFSLIPTLVMALPSCRRLETFLKLPECPRAVHSVTGPPAWVEVLPRPGQPGYNEKAGLLLQGSFAWGKHHEATLRNLNLLIPPGKLVYLLGPVGGGKTTFLNAIMGELFPVGDSRLEVPRKIAYSAQTPHLFEGSLKDNILKGDEVDEERYKEATFSACLNKDLEMLPGGDEVPVGGRGISLSGGQKARTSMARAAYDDADLVLLDDPFAAVDAHTGRHLHEHLIHGPLLQGRTRIVVAQPCAERIVRADWVIILADGEVKVQGTPAEVMTTTEYNKLLSSVQEGCHDEEAAEATTAPTTSLQPIEAFELREEECEGRASWATISYFIRKGGWVGITVCVSAYLVKNVLDMRTHVQLAMWMSHGSAYDAGLVAVKPNVWSYILGYVFWMGASTVAWFVSWVGGQSWTLGISEECHKAMVKALLKAPVDRFYDKTPVGRIMNRMANDMMNVDMQVFVGCCSTIGVTWSLCVPLYFVHLQMPLWFTLLTVPFYYLVISLIGLYWKTMVPLRYLMQVSKSGVSSEVADVETTPASVRAYCMQEVRLKSFTLAVRKMICADFLGRIICLRWLCNRLFVLGGCFVTSVALFCVWVPGVLDVGSASLVINTMFTLIVMIEGSINTGSGAQYQIIAMNRIYEYTSLPEEREEELPEDSTFQNFTVTVVRSLLGELESRSTPNGLQVFRRNGGHADVLLQQISSLPAFLSGPGRMMGDLAPTCTVLRKAHSWHRLIAVNGAHKTADDIVEELCHGDSEDVTLHVQSGWLADGVKVEIKNLRVGYADVPQDVLHGISVTMPRKCKTGVVGPTGCGKSTLLLSILRMLEPRDGRIYIEGVDTQSIGLRTLRMAFGLVPQDPVLLQGSMRFNIDPFELFDDERIWEALKLVQMDDYVKHLKDGLDFQVTGEGANLSFGQRQLLSLARNIVRKPMLLLLDEATSAIDPRTQELLQNTIEKSFQDSTMIVIAHRLETILDFDMVIVMERGRIAEKGPISELGKVKGGPFSKMLAAKGLTV